MEKKKRPRTLPRVRTIIQAAVFIFVFLGANVAALGKLGIAVPLPAFEVHGVCPFGGVETLYSLITGTGFIHKTHASSVILLVAVLASTLLFGAVFCGWLCPFGTFQEFIGKLGRRLFPRLYNRVPRKADRVLRYLRYGMLAFVIIMTARVGKMIFETFDPYSALMTFLSGEAPLLALAVLGAIAIASLFIERPFCRYLCPFGAILGLLGMVSLFRPRRAAHTCIGCTRCDHACPMGIRVSENEVVRDHACISCYRCMSAEACPQADTVVLAARKPAAAGGANGHASAAAGRANRVPLSARPLIAVAITLALAVAVVLTTQAAGLWTTGDKGNAPKAMANGAYSVEDIKGSNTFSQIEEYYGVPVAALAEAFGVEEAKAADFASKDVSSLYPAAAHAVNNNTVKAFVAFYTGAPVDLADGSVYLPQTAADAVLRDGAPTEDQKAYIASHTFDPNATDGASAASSGSDSASGPAYKAAKPAQSATSIDLTGGNTFVEVSSAYGIPAEDLSSAFGLSAEQYAFFQMKDLKTLYAQSPQAIGPASVKLFVALYAGYDYDLSVADTYLPRSAMDVLKQHGGLTPEQSAYLDAHTV